MCNRIDALDEFCTRRRINISFKLTRNSKIVTLSKLDPHRVSPIFWCIANSSLEVYSSFYDRWCNFDFISYIEPICDWGIFTCNVCPHFVDSLFVLSIGVGEWCNLRFACCCVRFSILRDIVRLVNEWLVSLKPIAMRKNVKGNWNGAMVLLFRALVSCCWHPTVLMINYD